MDQQDYYSYEPERDGRGWTKKEVPYEEPFFQEALTGLAGLNPFGKPNLRVMWAGTLLHDITETPQLKYKLTANVVTGYFYEHNSGAVRICKSKAEAEGAMKDSYFIPRREALALGRLRWVIEKWTSKRELIEAGRFNKLHDAEGRKILRDLPEEGVYDCFFWIETRGKKYRGLDREVLMAVEAMYIYNVSTSEAQKVLDDMERQKNQVLIGAEEAAAIWGEIRQ